MRPTLVKRGLIDFSLELPYNPCMIERVPESPCKAYIGFMNAGGVEGGNISERNKDAEGRKEVAIFCDGCGIDVMLPLPSESSVEVYLTENCRIEREEQEITLK